MKNNKAKTTFLSIIAMGFVLCIVMFMYYYSPTKEKKEALDASNATLQARVNELEKFYNEMPENKVRIEEMKKGIADMVKEFPADVKEEDTIYFAISSVQLENLLKLYQGGFVPSNEQFNGEIFAQSEGNKVEYAGLGIGEQEEMAYVDASIVSAAGIDDLNEAIVMQRRTVTYENITSYENLKALIQSVNCDPDKKTVSRLAYNANEEGALTGVLAVTFYSMSGTGKEYQPKDLGEYQYGLDNLFTNGVIEE